MNMLLARGFVKTFLFITLKNYFILFL